MSGSAILAWLLKLDAYEGKILKVIIFSLILPKKIWSRNSCVQFPDYSWFQTFSYAIKRTILTSKCFRQNQAKYFGLKNFSVKASQIFWLENYFGKIKPSILTWKYFGQNQSKYFDLEVFSSKASQIFWLEINLRFFNLSQSICLAFCRPLLWTAIREKTIWQIEQSFIMFNKK